MRDFEIGRGQPIPPWDGEHRLPIAGDVGPECGDSGTVFRLNSTYMDISDASHNIGNWLPRGLLMALLVSALLVTILWSGARWVAWPVGATGLWAVALAGATGVAWRLAGDNWHYLTRRPVRFNRSEKTLHAVRTRRFLSRLELGDHTVEIPWDDTALFCVHRRIDAKDGDPRFQIRCYQLDDAGMVREGIPIGREWRGLEGLNDLLAQWNYWCWYMNRGPEGLPLPMLFVSEKEGLFETFYYCLSEFGRGNAPSVRIALLPYFICLTTLRFVALRLCRPPVWPPAVRKISTIAGDDSQDLPTPDMPIGLPQMLNACLNNEYPLPQTAATPGWRGVADGIEHAKQWHESRVVGG